MRAFHSFVLALLVAVATPITGQAQDLRRLPQSNEEVQLSFAPIVRKVTPAVVNVYATTVTQQRESPFAGDPFFERFFGGDSPLFRSRPRQSQSLGSGVIIGPNGTILTNSHVVSDATDIRVSLSNGKEYPVDLVLDDSATDLAVLKVRDAAGEIFPTLEFSNSDSLEVGDLVLAVGNPFGVGQTVTSGIVSALARTGVNTSDFGFYIQTDAAINPGNSGGALVDMQGRLIGINAAIFSASGNGGSIGIGFAIPSNMARIVADAGISGEDIVRPWFGAYLQDVTSDIARSLGLDRVRGAIVTEVEPESPAAIAGLTSGDVILNLDGVAIADTKAFEFRYATLQIGTTVRIGYLRNGAVLAADVSLTKAPPPQLTRRAEIRGNSRLAGAIAVEMNARFARELGYRPDARGILIVEVQPGSPAQRLGLQVNDVILSLNGEPMTDLETFAEVAQGIEGGMRIELQRGNQLIRQFLGG